MADRSDETRDTRAGDILGLGGPTTSPRGTDVPDNTTKTPRRRRHLDETDPMTESSDAPTTRGAGATGIDMGSGGEGTDIE